MPYCLEPFQTCYMLNSLLIVKGYPIELLPLTVAAIPSMHICINFLPELLTQPSLEKQVVKYTGI